MAMLKNYDISTSGVTGQRSASELQHRIKLNIPGVTNYNTHRSLAMAYAGIRFSGRLEYKQNEISLWI